MIVALLLAAFPGFAQAQPDPAWQNITSTGALIYGGSYPAGQGPANAFDGAGTYYSGAASAATFVGRDVGPPRTLRYIQARGTASFSFVGRLRYSDDGINYTDTATTISIGAYNSAWHQIAVPDYGAHRYWVIADLQDDAYFQIDELRWFAPLSTELDNVTMLGSHIQGGGNYLNQGPGNAFGAPGAYYSGTTSSGTYIGRDFGTPRELRRLEATGTAGFSFAGRVRYSDDGINFTDTSSTFSMAPYTSGTQSVTLASYGAHRYWVVADLQDDAWLQIDELKMYAAQSSVELQDVTSLGTTVSGGGSVGGQVPSNVFGAPAAWYSGPSSANTFVGRDLGSARSVRRIDTFGTSSFSFYGRVKFSDDGVVWWETLTVINIAPHSSSWQSFNLSDYGPHRYWAVFDLQDDSYLQLDEMKLFAAVLSAPPSTPVISLPSGTYSTSQTAIATISTSGATIRYTQNGVDPTESDPIVTSGSGIAVNTSQVLKLRGFKPGALPSAVASATYAFNYGTLSPPTPSVTGGVYSSAQTVSLAAASGAAIRYTTNGSDPTVASALYTSPIVVSSGSLQIRARAFHPDWAASATAAATYTIDTTPPTISASVTPAPNSYGWNNSPVRVVFTCSDNHAGVNCPASVTVEQDGGNQLVTRVATDAAGNTAQTSAVVNIDSVPPVITLTSDIPAETTNSSVSVDADVSDALAGVASGRCSWVAATVTPGALNCNVPLKLGRNIVVATVVDLAGNTASASNRSVKITNDLIDLTITPSTAAVLVDEQRQLTAVDQFGRLPANVSWTTSDTAVATLTTDAEGTVFAVGVGPGTATITATLSGESAAMTLTVHSGPALPAGTHRWTAPSRAGIAAAETVFANQVSDGDAIYSVEYGSTDGGNRVATVRAYGVDGSENWFGALPAADEEVIRKVMPHGAGGIVAVLHTYANPPVPAAVVRYSGTDSGSWRYQSGAWRMQAVAGSDGTVYVVEEVTADGGSDARVVVLNGQTGAVIARHSLPNAEVINEAQSFREVIDPVGFTVDAKDHARFMLRHGFIHYTGSGVGSLSYTLELYDVAPSGGIAITEIDSVSHPSVSAMHYLRPESLTPDGDGVLALYVRRQGASEEEQWHGNYSGDTNATFTLPSPWHPTVSSHYGVGVGRGDEPTDPLVARNLRTGVLLWQNPTTGTPFFTFPSGGARIVSPNGDIQRIGPDGSAGIIEGISSQSPAYAYGRVHDRGVNQTLRAVPLPVADDSTAFIQRSQGGLTRVQDFGVFAKSFWVEFVATLPSKHVGLRILPRNQEFWRANGNARRSLFIQRDNVLGELWFLTLGAVETNFYLDSRVNSSGDVELAAVDLERISMEVGEEDSKIETLIARTLAYPNGTLDYEAWPGLFPGSDGYNSNSWLRGLLDACGLNHPSFVGPVLFPGWSKPVLSVYFGQ